MRVFLEVFDREIEGREETVDILERSIIKACNKTQNGKGTESVNRNSIDGSRSSEY